MFGSSVLEVAIGLIFVYLLLSLICSAVNEIIEAFLKNRATDLERGIRELFNQGGGGDIAEDFYNHPLINGLFSGTYERGQSRSIGFSDYLKPTNLPSYIPARNFAYAVIDILLHPPAEAPVTRDDDPASGAAPSAQDEGAAVNAPALPATMDAVRINIRRNFGDTQFGRALRTLAEQSGDDIDAMRDNVEAWFNGSMDRVSGWYKRRTKWIILWLGLALTIALNINTITVAKRLSTDATLRNVIVAQAESFANRPDALQPNFEANKKELEGLGLPVGWPNGIVFLPEPFRFWDHLLLPLLGWLLTASAISMGAPFWFDLLNKVMVIRSTVKPHEKSLEEGSEDRQPDVNSAPSYSYAATGTKSVGLETAFMPEPVFSAAPEPKFAALPDQPDNESHIDGCDVPIEDPTPDEDLPPTKGGVG